MGDLRRTTKPVQPFKGKVRTWEIRSRFYSTSTLSVSGGPDPAGGRTVPTFGKKILSGGAGLGGRRKESEPELPFFLDTTST
jgi:hypothetical protein